MSVYSMTGYASLQKAAPARVSEDSATPEHADVPTWRLQLEIRCVNSRFLDLSLKLADDLRAFEAMARERLQGALRRGKVELRASIAPAGPGAPGLQTPSAAALQQLASSEEIVRMWLPDAPRLSVADVLRLSQAGGPALPTEQLTPLVSGALDELLARLQQTRQTEGAQLRDALLQRVSGLRELAAQAEPLIPQLVAAQRARFLERWREATEAAQPAVDAAAAHDRALSEATAFALRIDVAEELTRLQAHLDTIEQLLRRGGEVGKRLDFLIQELHREANTLGSKSATLETSRIALDMKVLIEQMREQVQNIE